jgi:drug/metabolite transporter (DMT)-like permease
LVLTGSICFSSKAIFVKLAYNYTISPSALLCLRMLFSFPFFLVAAIYTSSKKTNIKMTAIQWFQLAFLGFAGYYLASLLDFEGLKYVTASIERLILFVYPTLVVLFSSLLHKTRIKKIHWVALLLTYIGILLAVGEGFNNLKSSNYILGAVLVFGCAVTYAMYIVGSGSLIPKLGSVKFTSYAMSFSCIAVIAHYLIFDGNSLLKFPAKVYEYSVWMALVATVLPTFIVSKGIGMIGSGTAAIVASIGPVSTIILANIFLGEKFTLIQMAGTMFVLSGVLLVSLRKNKEEKIRPE